MWLPGLRAGSRWRCRRRRRGGRPSRSRSPGGDGHVVHLVAQRLRLDLHAVLDAGHAVDHERVRAGDVDDDLGVDLAAVVERDADHLAAGLADLGHLAAVEELPALGLGGALQVVRRERRVVDVAGVGRVDRAGELLRARRGEVVVGRARGRPELVHVEDRHLLLERRGVPLLVRHAQAVVVRQHLVVVPGRALEQDRARLHVLGEPRLVGRLEVLGPVLPVEEALVGHRHAVERRVVGAHDRARVRRRAVAGRRELVDVQRLVAALAELECRGRADHSGADDHCVDLLSHHVLRSLAFSLSRNAAWKRRTCSCMRACASAPSPRTIASTTASCSATEAPRALDAVERHAPQPQHVAVQPVELRREQRVARRLGDRRVQLAVELDQRLVVARCERAARALDERAQRLALLARRRARRPGAAARPSSSTRSSKISCRSAASSSATSVPRRGRMTTMFSQARRRSALRTGARPTPSSAASAASLTAEPGRQLERHDALPDARRRRCRRASRARSAAAGARRAPRSGAACGRRLAGAARD